MQCGWVRTSIAGAVVEGEAIDSGVQGRPDFVARRGFKAIAPRAPGLFGVGEPAGTEQRRLPVLSADVAALGLGVIGIDATGVIIQQGVAGHVVAEDQAGGQGGHNHKSFFPFFKV